MPAGMPPEDELVVTLREHGQERMALWLQRLRPEQRARLQEQLRAVDFEQLDEFRELIRTPPTEFGFNDVVPAPVKRLPLSEAEREAERKVEQLGRKALEGDRVAALTVAGGQGTRLRYDHPKGTYPISPIRRASLFQLFAEQILAARRRYGCRMPWLIMTSPTNDAETRRFFEERDYFGLGAETVHLFIQGTNPILDREGRLLLFRALAESGLLERLRRAGHDLISYFQVDNPLVTVADPRFLGHHLSEGAEFSCKVVAKRDPGEGLGVAVHKAGQPMIVEYIDLPPEVATAREPTGMLRFLYGSIAIHIVEVPFAERVARAGRLPWHVARKRYEIVGPEGKKALSEPKGCYKFERFIFDALVFAERSAFVEVSRATEFSPVKSLDGPDSPDAARAALQRMWLEWLQGVGVAVEMPKDFSEPVVEISPLFASDAEELKERLRPDWKPSFPLLLEG